MAHSTAKPLLRRPLAAKDSKAGTGEAAKAIDGLVQDLNDIFDRNLSDIYQTAEDNSSYAQDDSPSERSYDSYPHVENRQPSPRTAYLKSMMRKKGSRAREFTEEDMYQFGSYNSNAGLHQPFRVRGPKPFHTSHSIKQPSVVSLAYLNAKDRHQASIQASKAFNKQAASASAVMAAAEAKAAALKAKNCNRSKLARAKSASACFEMCTDCGKMQFMGAEIKPLTRTASKNKTPRH